MSYNPNASGVPAVARSISRTLQNSSGNTLVKGTPVRLVTGVAQLIDPSNEASANSIAGAVKTSLANGAPGEIVSTGVIEDVTTSFANGDVVFVGKNGLLTNIPPSIGVNGFVHDDWIIRIGIITQNVANASLKDLSLNIELVGVL